MASLGRTEEEYVILRQKIDDNMQHLTGNTHHTTPLETLLSEIHRRCARGCRRARESHRRDKAVLGGGCGVGEYPSSLQHQH